MRLAFSLPLITGSGLLHGIVLGREVLPNPVGKLGFAEAAFGKADVYWVQGNIIGVEGDAIEQQKGFACDCCSSLVSICEWVIACQSIRQACRQLGQVRRGISVGVPLLRASDLAAGLALLHEGGDLGFAFPVVPFPSPVQRALRRGPDGRLSPLQPEHVATRSQDLEPAYHDAGQCYWALARTWRAGRPIHADGRGWVMPAWRTIDVDVPDDWTRAEALYRALNDTVPA